VWEEELLEECRMLLLEVSLQNLSADVWQWLPDLSGGYSVSGAYDVWLLLLGFCGMNEKICYLILKKAL